MDNIKRDNSRIFYYTYPIHLDMIATLENTRHLTSNKATHMSNKVAIADDQQLFLKSLSMLVNTFDGFTVLSEANNGQDLINFLKSNKPLPDIILLDVNMPGMDGITAAETISKLYPEIKLVALSMNDEDNIILKMVRAGCCSYLLKDIHPIEFEKALNEIATKGFYNADAFNVNYRRILQMDKKLSDTNLSENETTFLQLACSELTYKQIAAQMHLAERTIDGYRESLFHKLKVQTRVGMVLEGMRLGLINKKSH